MRHQETWGELLFYKVTLGLCGPAQGWAQTGGSHLCPPLGLHRQRERQPDLRSTLVWPTGRAWHQLWSILAKESEMESVKSLDPPVYGKYRVQRGMLKFHADAISKIQPIAKSTGQITFISPTNKWQEKRKRRRGNCYRLRDLKDN